MAASSQRDLLSIPKGDREELWRYAQLAVKGGFAGRHKTAESAYCAILYGVEVGLTINQALQCIYVVNGRASMETEAKAALVVSHGFPPPRTRLEGEDTPEQAVAWCRCRRDGEVVERRFSFAEAKAVGLTGKDVWRGYWRDMLRWRAMDRAIDEAFPDVVKGLASAETMRAVQHDAIRQDLGSVAAEEVLAALEETATEPPQEKPRRRRGRPRKEERDAELAASGLSEENLSTEGLAQAAEEVAEEPAVEPDADQEQVDKEWLWHQWRRASASLTPKQIHDIKDEILAGEDKLFCSADLTAEQIEHAIRLAR